MASVVLAVPPSGPTPPPFASAPPIGADTVFSCFISDFNSILKVGLSGEAWPLFTVQYADTHSGSAWSSCGLPPTAANRRCDSRAPCLPNWPSIICTYNWLPSGDHARRDGCPLILSVSISATLAGSPNVRLAVVTGDCAAASAGAAMRTARAMYRFIIACSFID